MTRDGENTIDTKRFMGLPVLYRLYLNHDRAAVVWCSRYSLYSLILYMQEMDMQEMARCIKKVFKENDFVKVKKKIRK